MHQGTAGNIPLAAAFPVVPIIIIMGIYLSIAKKWEPLKLFKHKKTKSQKILRFTAISGLLFLHIPILLIII